MPEAPKQPCNRCKKILSTDTYCASCMPVVHQREKATRQKYDKRKPSSQRGYDARWQKIRKVKLAMNPLCECQDCKEAHRITIANVVHHIVAIDENPSLRLDIDNLMSMSRACHEVEHGRLNKGVRGV